MILKSEQTNFLYLVFQDDSGISHHSNDDKDQDILKMSAIHSEASHMSETSQMSENANHSGNYVDVLIS